MNSKKVVGIGEVLWDILPGKKVVGGAPANFIHHIAQFGYPSTIISAIGKDQLGNILQSRLERFGVETLIAKTKHPTGTVLVRVDKEGIPQYDITQDVAWDYIPYTAELEAIAKTTNVVCFGTLAQRNVVSRDTIQQFVKNVPNESLKILDINIRQDFFSEKVITQSLKLANILKLNEEEVILLGNMLKVGLTDEQDICVALMKQFKLELVILTKGGEGSYVFNNKETSYIPSASMPIADTVGAGDAFTAGFIASYLTGARIQDAHRLASQVASYVCAQHGAMPILPDAFREMFKK